MCSLKPLLVVVTASAALLSQGVHANTVVNFDAVSNFFQGVVYSESGFTLTNVEGLAGYNVISIWNSGTNSTPSYAFCSISTTSSCKPGVHIRITQDNGGAFSFNSFLGANYQLGNVPSTFSVAGTLAGGGTVSQTFAAGDSWTQYNMVGFGSVTDVTFSNFGGAYAAAIDNLNFGTAVAAVPEPATWSLFGMGAMLVALSRRRQRKA
jgi:hypothetical protein